MNGQLVRTGETSVSCLHVNGYDGEFGRVNARSSGQTAKLPNTSVGESSNTATKITLPDANHALSAEEKSSLQQCEEVIQQGWTVFLEVGRALAKIRDAQLYRQNYASFEVYCREKWQYGKAYAYRLIAAAEVVKCLSPIGDTLPIHEAQVRPLIGLPKDKIELVWGKAVESADGHPVTAKHVKAAVASLVPSKAVKKKRSKVIEPLKIEELSTDKHMEKAIACIDRLMFLASKGGNHLENTLKMANLAKAHLLAIQTDIEK